MLTAQSLRQTMLFGSFSLCFTLIYVVTERLVMFGRLTMCMLQIADAIPEAICYMKTDPPWIEQKFINSVIGIFKFQSCGISYFI